jgi:hypothetical protein
VRVGDFSVVEVFRRASLVRVGMWSRRFVRRFGPSRLGGQSFWRGFLRGLFFLIVDCGYPLFVVSDKYFFRFRSLLGTSYVKKLLDNINMCISYVIRTIYYTKIMLKQLC